MSKLSAKTERRLDAFDTALKKVEADTLWKIKDYEKLLEARPTLQYVKSAMSEEGRDIFVRAKVYTDDELKKIKESDQAAGKLFERFSLDMKGHIRDLNEALV